jgi:hypothetical protein
MHSPDSSPPPSRPEVVLEDTINELLALVDTVVTPMPPPADEHLRFANLNASSQNGDPLIIHIRQTPLEFSEDGSTLFIHVYPPGATQPEDHVHWNFYPSDGAGALTKGSPISPTQALMERASETESAEEWLDTVIGHARNVKDEERRAGFRTAYDDETKQLIEQIRNGTPIDEQKAAKQGKLKGILRWLGVTR